MLEDMALIIQVKVIPHAKKTEIVGEENGILKIRIHAPPDKGKANEELIAFLAKLLGLAKSDLKIISGSQSRLKKIKIETITRFPKF